MTSEHTAELAEWMANNTRGFARREGDKIYLEGTIDTLALLRYAQSLPCVQDTRTIHADNRRAYTGRPDMDRGNAVVEGADC